MAARDDKMGIVALLKGAWKEFGEDECNVRAAALSYFTVFALPPLLILLIMVAGMLWDPAEVQRALETQFAGLIGDEGSKQIHEIIARADRPGSGGAFATIASLAGLVFGATGAFLQLQGALNKAWEVKPDPERSGIKVFLTKRVLSLGMVLGVGFLLAVGLAVSAGISALGGMIGGSLPEPVLHVINYAVSFAVLALLFAAMFKVLPDAEITWRDVWVGGAATAALFVAGKFAIGFYLGRSNPGDAFGAAGALAIILVWAYYSSMILLFGAEFTQQWMRHRGSGVRPEHGAVRVITHEELVRPNEEPEATDRGDRDRKGGDRVAARGNTKGGSKGGAKGKGDAKKDGAQRRPVPDEARAGTRAGTASHVGRGDGRVSRASSDRTARPAVPPRAAAATPERGGLGKVLLGLPIFMFLSRQARRDDERGGRGSQRG